MSRSVVLLLLTSVVFSCTYSVADSVCQSTIQGALPGTTCTIGNATFQFLPFTPTPGTSVVTSQITFTPYVDSSLGPGFTLTFPDTLFSVAGGGNLGTNAISITLNFTVSITEPTSANRITGSMLSIGSDSVISGQFSFGDAFSVGQLSAVTPNCGNTLNRVGYMSSNFFVFGGQTSDSSLLSGGCGATSATGSLLLDVDAGGVDSGASASLTGPVTFVINEQTPEPSSMILFGSGILTLAGYCKHIASGSRSK